MNSTLYMWVVDPLERAFRTFAQQFFVVILAAGVGGPLVHPQWALAADSAAFAAIVALVTTYLTMKLTVKSNSLDLGLRVVKTFVQSVIGTITATNVLSVAHTNWKVAFAVALPVAMTAFVTGLAALSLPDTIGASLIPAGSVAASGGGVDNDGDEIDVQAEQQRVYATS